MICLELTFSPLLNEEDQSILAAELLEVGFDSFVEGENDLLAYMDADSFTDDLIKKINFLKIHPEITIRINPLEDINWNKEWESNYQPVTIAGKCYVRAPFHPTVNDMDYEIIIEPKMSFGTAHHETTQLMAGWLMDLDIVGKQVLDMGCGTGILAILANKMGCLNVTGIDNDEWAYRNAMENFRNNGLPGYCVIYGDAALIRKNCYDVILANINRNILLQDMKSYAEGLRNGGVLLLSGFYENDIETIFARAVDFGLNLWGKRTLNDWAVLNFCKLKQ
jgi:ribosomal protein L11 methyltransferase